MGMDFHFNFMDYIDDSCVKKVPSESLWVGNIMEEWSLVVVINKFMVLLGVWVVVVIVYTVDIIISLLLCLLSNTNHEYYCHVVE